MIPNWIMKIMDSVFDLEFDSKYPDNSSKNNIIKLNSKRKRERNIIKEDYIPNHNQNELVYEKFIKENNISFSEIIIPTSSDADNNTTQNINLKSKNLDVVNQQK